MSPPHEIRNENLVLPDLTLTARQLEYETYPQRGKTRSGHVLGGRSVILSLVNGKLLHR